MNAKQINFLTILLLLVMIAGGSACSLTKTNAQSPKSQTEATRTEVADSTTPAYKPPKRVSKDVIKTSDKKEETSRKKVAK